MNTQSSSSWQQDQQKQRLSVAPEFCRHNTTLKYFCEGGTNINFLLCDKIQGVAH